MRYLYIKSLSLYKSQMREVHSDTDYLQMWDYPEGGSSRQNEGSSSGLHVQLFLQV